MNTLFRERGTEFPQSKSPSSRGIQPAGAVDTKPKLLDRVRQAIRTRHYSPRTEKAYLGWIKRFIFFHPAKRDHPAEMGETEIAQFLSSLGPSSTEQRRKGRA